MAVCIHPHIKLTKCHLLLIYFSPVYFTQFSNSSFQNKSLRVLEFILCSKYLSLLLLGTSMLQLLVILELMVLLQDLKLNHLVLTINQPTNQSITLSLGWHRVWYVNEPIGGMKVILYLIITVLLNFAFL